MRQKLFVIEDTFQITGRGIVVTGKLKLDSPAFKAGSAVILIRPDGKEFTTKVFGIEQVKPIDYENFNWNRIGVMFENIICKEDVPIGTEIFLDEN